jgi:hypothetical protein
MTVLSAALEFPQLPQLAAAVAVTQAAQAQDFQVVRAVAVATTEHSRAVLLHLQLKVLQAVLQQDN